MPHNQTTPLKVYLTIFPVWPVFLLVMPHHSPPSVITLEHTSEVHWIYGTVWLGYEIQSLVPPSHQSVSSFSEKHEVPSPKCIGVTGLLFDLNTNIRSHVPLSHQSFSPFSEKHEVPSPKCVGFKRLLGWKTLVRSINRYTLTIYHARYQVPGTIRKFHPRRKKKNSNVAVVRSK